MMFSEEMFVTPDASEVITTPLAPAASEVMVITSEAPPLSVRAIVTPERLKASKAVLIIAEISLESLLKWESTLILSSLVVVSPSDSGFICGLFLVT